MLWDCAASSWETKLGAKVVVVGIVAVNFAELYRRLFRPLLLLIVLAACEPANEVPTVLRIGVLPDQSRAALERRYTPLFDYLSNKLDIKYELVIPRSYGHLLALFHEKKVELAYFGGLTFIKARHADGAVPIVMRDVDARFSSYLLVRTNDTAKSVQDLRQRVLTFGPKLSSSGHLMPRHYLMDMGILPETHFAEVWHSNAHDETARLVRDGVVDAGAINGLIAEAMFADGRLRRDEVRVLWNTPPYPDYVWAMRKEIAQPLRAAVQDAFLALSIQDAEHADVLVGIGAGRFLPVPLPEFERLERIADKLGLIEG